MRQIICSFRENVKQNVLGKIKKIILEEDIREGFELHQSQAWKNRCISC